jgi:hypothetical protein
LIVASIGWARVAPAQRAEIPQPAGPRTIVGVVTDANARPLEDVEIRLGSLNRVTRSRRDGGFRFDSVPAGKHELRARRLGFEAQTRTVPVEDKGGAVLFRLKALPQALATVVTSVPRGGLSGSVTDSVGRPLPGAAVRVFGGAIRTVTDSAGEFYMDVRRGAFMVRITSKGHASRLLSVTIPSDSGRRIAVAMGRGRAASARDEIEMQNLARRLAWRIPPSAFFGREKLDELGNKRLLALVRGANPNPLDEAYCTAVVNGGPDVVPLWYFDVDELEAVEVYPRGSLSYITGAKREKATAFGRGPQGGAVRNCPTVYVWLR